jgi:tetratricopeptide (TPR) repeat protein
MASEEIERLKERVDKDPNSKLFVPLAEEYKKIGMFDEAIETLSKGLERYPGYMSAHVSLGKIYLDKGMFDKASAEFEKVVNTIPDNLYAHRKLAEIYRDLSINEKAIEEFRKVLKLNPLDWDAEKSLATLVGEEPVQPGVTEAVKKGIVETEKPSEMPAPEPVKELQEAPFGIEEEITETSIEEELPEISESVSEDIEESDFSISDIHETQVEEIPGESKIDLSIADSYISQGEYLDALDIYKRLLSIEPDNVHVLQRIEELKTLLELLGKDKEDLIAKMNIFLDGIRKRRDEFFGTLQ